MGITDGYNISLINIETHENEMIKARCTDLNNGVLDDDMFVTNNGNAYEMIEIYSELHAKPPDEIKKYGYKYLPNQIAINIYPIKSSDFEDCNLIHEPIRNCSCDERCETLISVDNYPCKFLNNYLSCSENILDMYIPDFCKNNSSSDVHSSSEKYIDSSSDKDSSSNNKDSNSDDHSSNNIDSSISKIEIRKIIILFVILIL